VSITLVVALAVGANLVTPTATDPDPRLRSARWKINTHLYAANKALADALDGKVNIPPYGEFTVSASALRALRAEPSAYRAGVLAPDLFPDMYFGGWVVHSDFSETADRWTADHWMRHVWTTARGWQDASERDKVMAFAYGFLTHGAGDIWAHSYVNQKADGAWVTFTGPARSTALKHVVLEGYIGAHTPDTDVSLDVWPRLVANILVKHPSARRHSTFAVYYQKWLDLYDWLEKKIGIAKEKMNEDVGADAPYWLKCATHPVTCARKEQMESWRLDINRGIRALVDSSQSLGDRILADSTSDGVDAMTGWAAEWVPKMFGAHAIGEGVSEMAEFLEWVGDPLAPITEPVEKEVKRFMREEFPRYYELYQLVKDPAYHMDQSFPAGTRQLVDRDMGIPAGSDRAFSWRDFEPVYNSVILSKLVLLDGDGLNELARRAGIVEPLFKPGEETNIMLGFIRSMTQSFQWIGDTVRADTGSTITKFGVCGPEGEETIPKVALCGVKGRDYDGKSTKLVGRTTARSTLGTAPGGGFIFWRHPEAREKVFGRIFKGYGPGPGETTPGDIFADLPPAPGSVRGGARALRAASDQAELIREIVAIMAGKVGGVLKPAAPATRPVGTAQRPTLSGRPAPRVAASGSAEVVTNWGARCCGKDVAQIRAALAIIKAQTVRVQGADVLKRLGRRPTASSLPALISQLESGLTAFENTRDAATATAALANVARLSNTLAAVVAGTR
jgi:hypothetical protein